MRKKKWDQQPTANRGKKKLWTQLWENLIYCLLKIEWYDEKKMLRTPTSYAPPIPRLNFTPLFATSLPPSSIFRWGSWVGSVSAQQPPSATPHCSPAIARSSPWAAAACWAHPPAQSSTVFPTGCGRKCAPCGPLHGLQGNACFTVLSAGAAGESRSAPTPRAPPPTSLALVLESNWKGSIHQNSLLRCYFRLALMLLLLSNSLLRCYFSLAQGTECSAALV